MSLKIDEIMAVNQSSCERISIEALIQFYFDKKSQKFSSFRKTF